MMKPACSYMPSTIDLVQKSTEFTFKGVADRIKCPTLVMEAQEDDSFSGQPKLVYTNIAKYFLNQFISNEGLKSLIKPQHIENFKSMCPETFRELWVSLQLSQIAFLILYYLKLTQYDMTKQLETVESLTIQALELDSGNAFGKLILGFTQISKNTIIAERMINDARKLFDSYIFSNIVDTLIEKETIAYLGLATIYDKRGVFVEAQKYFDKALTETESDFMRSIIILNRGLSKLQDDRTGEALSDFLGVKDKMHTSSLAYTNIGIVYYKQGIYDRSEQMLISAIELDPFLPEPYYNLGVLYDQQSRREQSKRLFKTVLAINQNFIDAETALKIIQKTEKQEIVRWNPW